MECHALRSPGETRSGWSNRAITFQVVEPTLVSTTATGTVGRIRSTALERGDKWHFDEVVVTINGKKHWLWRAVDRHGAVLDVQVQSRRDRHAARRLMRKLLGKHGRAPRVLITDKLRRYAAANRDLGLNIEHRQHKGLNNRAERTQAFEAWAAVTGHSMLGRLAE